MRLSPSCRCCNPCGPLPGCSRSLSTVTLTSDLPGIPSITLTLDTTVCKWVGCGLRPSALFRALRPTCATPETSGAHSQPRVYQMTSGGGLVVYYPMIACTVAPDPRAAYHTSGDCPADLTSSLPFGTAIPSYGGGGAASALLTEGQVYTAGGTSASYGVLSCNPFHGRFSVSHGEGTSETVDVTE
jgi:hypothetical protein